MHGLKQGNVSLIFRSHCSGNYKYVCNFLQMKARAIKVILNCISTTRHVRKLFQITLNLGGYRIVETGLEIRTAD